MSRWFVGAMAYLHFLPLWLIAIATDVIAACGGRLSWLSPVMFAIYAIVVLSAASWVVVDFNFRRVRNDRTSFQRTIISFHEEKAKCAELVITYILPFVGVDCTTLSGLVVLLILVGVIVSVCACHFNWQTNVILDWMGYSLYKCEVKDVNGDISRCFVLSKTLSGCRNRTLTFYPMNSDKMNGDTYFVEKEDDDNETL